MKTTFYLLLFIHIIGFSQETPVNPIIENENDINNYGERILLYEIEIDDKVIPIEIVYNHNGFKALECPNILGLGWSLNNLGKISRVVNHIPDDCFYQNSTTTGGWFVNDNSSLSLNGQNTPQYDIAKEILNTKDQKPDFYTLNSAFGLNTLFTYDKSVTNDVVSLTPLILDTNQDLNIITNYNNMNYGMNDFSSTVFEIDEVNGLKYKFIGGPVNQTITRNGGNNYKFNKDFYLNKILSNHSNESITINYLERNNQELNYFENATISYSSNSASRTYSDYTITSDNELIVNEVVTSKVKIYFNYSYIASPNTTQSSQYEDLPLLNSIIIKNLNDEQIAGYLFNYDDNFSLGRPLLTSIYKSKKDSFDFNLANMIKYKEFVYFQSPVSGYNLSINHKGIDAFGFLNGALNSSLLPVSFKDCGLGNSTIYPAADRKPNLGYIKAGVLKKVINNFGGIVEYDYQLNADVTNDLYGGGLKVAKVIIDSNYGTPEEIIFKYFDYKGFGVSLSNPQSSFIGSYLGNSGNNAEVSSNINNELHEYDQQAALYDLYQKSGNFFGKIYSLKFIEDGAYDIINNSNVKNYLTTEFNFISNLKTLIRTPLLSSKVISSTKVYTDIYEERDEWYGGYYVTSQKVSELNNNYELLNVDSIESNDISNINIASCTSDPVYEHIYISSRPILKKEQFLKESEIIEYLESPLPNNIYQTSTTKQEFIYLGENSTYQLNTLLPKEIKTFKNNFPVGKIKFKYLIEFNTTNSGLTSALPNFLTENKTLVTEVSNWVYNNNNWNLKAANFYDYFSDGKIKETSSVLKTINNTLFTEGNFNTLYISGSLTNVPFINKVQYNYDLNGKISFIVNSESQIFTKFYRDNDFNSGLINTTLKGPYNSIEPILYRQSFENTSVGVLYADALTGEKVFNGATLDLGNYPANSIVSFWYYFNSNWEYKTFIHLGGDVIINMPTGAMYIDEVWIRPTNTSLEGSTVNKFLQTSHVINDKGFVVKTIYDDFGREIKQVDKDGNLINETQFNYTQE